METTASASPKKKKRRGLRGSWRRWLVRLLIVLISLEVAAYCLTGTLARQIVRAPNAGRQFDASGDPPSAELSARGITHQLRINTGPPVASLLVWVIDPPATTAGTNPPIRGTIFCFHGHMGNKEQMVGAAQAFAAAGYRAVLFDLRGNGRSSGDFLTFGFEEAQDARQILEALESQGLAAGPVGAFGRSYGGATAIEWAGIDPRVRSVVAISPFASMRDAVRDASRVILPLPVRWLVGWRIDPAIDQAGKLAGFDPDAASPERAITRTTAPVLLFHGTEDGYVLPENSQRLHDDAPDRTRLEFIPGRNHDTVMDGEVGAKAMQEATEWFNQHLPRISNIPAPPP